MTSSIHAAEPEQHFESHAEFYRVSAYAAFPQEHRAGGSFGLSGFKVEQSPIDFIDAPVPELIFCRSDTEAGEVLVDSGDGSHLRPCMSHNELVVYPANTATRTRATSAHKATLICLPINSISEEMTRSGIGPDGGFFAPWLSRAAPMPVSASRLMDRMWRLLDARGPVDHLLLDGLTLQFLAEMARARELAPLGGARPDDRRIARVIDYIEAHLGEHIDIGALAATACLSPAHFSRVFKATVGEPVWAYVQQRRCVRAKELLIGTCLPLVEIAYRCGFSSQAHFTRSLKAHFGVTPGKIRAASK